MLAENLAAALYRASDPVLLVDDSGTVLYGNLRSNELFGRDFAQKRPLTEILSEPISRQILQLDHYTSVEAEVDTNLGKVRQTVVASDVSAGDPDAVLLLLVFKSVPPESRRIDERQEFLASIAHDLKNPLGAIFGYADALLDTPAGEGLSEKQRDVIARMRNTASRSIDLVRNYQHLSALRTSTITVSGSPIDLNMVVKSVVDYTWREDSSVAPLKVEISRRPLPVRVERIQLERIISNLLTNALKYTPKNEKISIKTWTEDGKALFMINNTAPVIDKSELPLLFERYGRTTSSAGKSGSGLGLYIVKFLLDALRGSIAVKSRQGEGTTFTVTLPLVE